MTPMHALLWFVAMTVGVFGLIGGGTYLAMHSYGNRDVDDRRHT